MVEAYQGLTVEDFARGVNRMKQEQWPPTIPEFRSWCEAKADDWLRLSMKHGRLLKSLLALMVKN